MELNLRKPIVFFDLETTGINITHDRIVEISIVKIMPNGEKIERTRRVNPEMPIPAEATAIHHITDEDVAGEPTFRQLAKSLAAVFTVLRCGRIQLKPFRHPYARPGIP